MAVLCKLCGDRGKPPIFGVKPSAKQRQPWSRSMQTHSASIFTRSLGQDAYFACDVGPAQ